MCYCKCFTYNNFQDFIEVFVSVVQMKVLCYMVVFAGRIQEAMREFDILKDKRDVNLCSTMALMYGHKHSQAIGQLFTSSLRYTWVFSCSFKEGGVYCFAYVGRYPKTCAAGKCPTS